MHRAENRCSHELAQFAPHIEWECDFPVWLLELARKEMRAGPLFVMKFCNIKFNIYIYLYIYKAVNVCWKNIYIIRCDI